MDFDAYERGLWAGRAAAYERGFARLTAHTAPALLDAATVARIETEFDRLAARYLVGKGMIALPAVAVLASGTR